MHPVSISKMITGDRLTCPTTGVLKENSLKGEETLFVDDALVNVEGAKRAGLKGLYLRPGITLMDFLW